MLAVAIIAGEASVDAKTKKSSASSSKSSLTLATFTDKSSKSKFRNFRSEKTITSKLKALGFTCDYNNVVREYNNQFNEYENITRYRYSKGGTTVTYDGYGEIVIKFSSSSQKDAFVNSAKSLGYRYSTSWAGGSYFIPGNEKKYWEGIFMYVDGNEVRLSGGGE